MSVIIWLVEHVYLVIGIVMITVIALIRRGIAARQLANLGEIIKQYAFTRQGNFLWPNQYLGMYRNRGAMMTYAQNIARPTKQSLTLSVQVSTAIAMVISAFPSTTLTFTALPTLKTNGEYSTLKISSSTPAITDKFLGDPTAKAIILRLSSFGDDYGRFIAIGPERVALTVSTSRNFDTDTVNDWFTDVAALAEVAEKTPFRSTSL